MAKTTTTTKAKTQEDKKRRRRDVVKNTTKSSESSDPETQQQHSKAVSDSDGESASSDEEDDSSDDETENALFRPAAVKKESENGSDDDQENDEEETTEPEQDEPAAVAKPDAKKSKKAKTAVADAPDSGSKELEDEALRKTEATVYVEGIAYKADEGDLVSHFAPCGNVKEVRMPRYQDSGKPRGYAHVVFESASSVSKALALDGKYLLGRYLTVKEAERPRTLDAALQEQKSVKKAIKGCKTVFVKHLPYDVEESTVRDALASCGTVVSVRLPLWNHTKKLKGFGYVEFATEDEAVVAAKRSGMKIGDRMVIISLETVGSAPKASFRLSDGQFWKKGDEAKSSLATKLSEKPKKNTKPTGKPSEKPTGHHTSKKQKRE